MRLLFTTLIFLASMHAHSCLANVYVVFFMTEQGSTGHVGIAIDNYKIVVRDVWENGKMVSKEDTVKTNNLTFFDLWPERDVRNWRFNRNTAPKYFKLPRTSAENEVTVESLLAEGLPHRYRHACDALVMINSGVKEDEDLKSFIETLQEKRPYYNARKYNCADFVCLCLEKMWHKRVKAKEFVPMSWISTPNRLFKKLKKMPDQVLVIRDPGSKANGSFFVERILKN